MHFSCLPPFPPPYWSAERKTVRFNTVIAVISALLLLLAVASEHLLPRGNSPHLSRLRPSSGSALRDPGSVRPPSEYSGRLQPRLPPPAIGAQHAAPAPVLRIHDRYPRGSPGFACHPSEPARQRPPPRPAPPLPGPATPSLGSAAPRPRRTSALRMLAAAAFPSQHPASPHTLWRSSHSPARARTFYSCPFSPPANGSPERCRRFPRFSSRRSLTILLNVPALSS